MPLHAAFGSRTVVQWVSALVLLATPAAASDARAQAQGGGLGGATPSAGVEQPRLYCESSHRVEGGAEFSIYVDDRGGIFRFTGAAAWRARNPSEPTPAELEARYSTGRRRVGSVDPETLRRKFALVPVAAKGKLSQGMEALPPPGTPMEGTVWSCYAYHAERKRYLQVPLGERGVWTRQHTSPAGRELVRWLSALAEEARKAS